MSRFTAGERVERLLAIIPWVHDRGGATLDEIAARFDYPRHELVRDLESVVPFVGVWPFTPDRLVDVTIDDGRVAVAYAPVFDLPLRLRPDEALTVLAAAKAMLAATGVADADGEVPASARNLFRAVTKLQAVVGTDAGEVLEIRLGAGVDETLAVLREAIGVHRCVEIDYYSFGRDRSLVRTVEPHRIFVADGQWYLDAHCRLAGGERIFRVDRIRRATPTDDRFPPPDHAPATDVFASPEAADLPRVTLALSPGAAWVAEQYPHDEARRDDAGRTVVTLPVGGEAWLARLLVRLGPDAELVDDPGGIGHAARSRAASRILARYTASSP